MEEKKKRQWDFAAIIREYETYHGNIGLKKFCEDSGYPYNSVVRYYRKVFWDQKSKVGCAADESHFVEAVFSNQSSSEHAVPPQEKEDSPILKTYTIVNLNVSFSNGMQLSMQETDVDEICALLHKIVC